MQDIKSKEAAYASTNALIREKLKFLIPMTVIYMVSFIGLTLLADFAKPILGIRVVGALNLGFVLIAFNYLLSWALAVVYVRIANNRLDPLAAEAASQVQAARIKL